MQFSREVQGKYIICRITTKAYEFDSIRYFFSRAMFIGNHHTLTSNDLVLLTSKSYRKHAPLKNLPIWEDAIDQSDFSPS